LVGQGFVGADQGKMVMDQVRASKPTLEQVFKGEIPNNATLTIDNPADAPFLDLTQQEAEQQLADSTITKIYDSINISAS
jgi:hypothetical protein